ncbi:hypothetical protein LCGC14_0887390 [marine sediment metagenome]|uniref:CRISPR system ring nuclease SSO2081-like domain-containing protein n=1 Tax=marine sediment metagenome TaxID=412755 RepID=A0A0F9P540_9ZZZZ
MTKKENILIISLGRTPPVIPETLDALLERNIYIKRTYIVTTSDETILHKCIKMVENDFNKHYLKKNMELKPYSCILGKDDIYTQRDNLELMIKAGSLFKMESNNNIYVSMAGGRKTMSAAMALLAQIYNARAITHVLVSPEIEAKGSIYQLEKMTEAEREKILHPKEKRLILFPVIGISWMLNDIINALKGFQGSIIRKESTEILKINGLIGDNNEPTELGSMLLDLVSDIQNYPEHSSKLPFEKLKLKSNEPHAPKGHRKFVERLSLISFIDSIIGVKFVNSSKTRINEDNSAGEISCQFSDGNKAYVFKIITTAKTKGQNKMVRKYIEPLFHKK